MALESKALDACDFDAVYSAFYPRILRYLTRLVGPDEAEDVSQEVFSKISRSLGEFRGDALLSTWIYRIATNAARDRIRSAEYRTSLHSASTGGLCRIEDTPAPEADVSVERQAIRGEMSGCVQSMVSELPEGFRTVLALSDMEGLRNAEIAEVLGVTLETVKIRLHRARTKLRKRMESQCSLYRDRDNTLLCDLKVPPSRT
jgi:RNA polymerase sigma-70 factor, ECF subfamily